MFDVTRHFSDRYAEARDKFRAAVAHARVPLESHVNPHGSAPDGSELATDVAYFGHPEARNLLVLLSGVHGVEGYAGSGCQIALIERVRFVALPMSTAVLVVHAVDPYGFAWDRRVNEHGVDLNCNAIDHARAPAPAPLYDVLHPLLAERVSGDGARALAAWATLDALVDAHGERAVVEALTAGQYRYPDGLCYGGTHHEWSTVLFLDLMRRWGQGRRHIALIDIHASPKIPGDEVLIHPGHDSQEAARAFTWFGLRHTAARSFCTAASGNLVEAAAIATPLAERTPVQLDFGTVHWRTALEARCADLALQVQGLRQGPQVDAVRRAMRDSFYVAERSWQTQVVQRGEEAIAQALAGLAR